ncbi:YlxR family protein [Microbacterium stercoris]|uniref:YlxR family protein n=1 Tax=Microbacterium stercoris TaxID=2820289 RepID=UPI00355698FF
MVLRDLELVIDERKSAPGRGAWLHPTRECAENALKRRAFGRALRVSGVLDTQNLEKWLNGYGNQVNGSK